MIKERIKHIVRNEWALASVLLLTLFLRIFGIGFGLPLTLVSDEPPFTVVALKMIETQTLIPALQPEAFSSILLYPLYLSYVLLIPFVLILGVKYLAWDGSRELFEATLLTDLSPFFIAARCLNILLGILMVYLVYRVAQSLFHSPVAAFVSAYLVATSILHQALSMVGRHWMPSSFVFVLVLYTLSRDLPKKRRYLYASLIAGIGMGFSTLSILSAVLMALYYVIFDKEKWRDVVTDIPLIAQCSAIFVALAAIPFLLYKNGNAFFGAITLLNDKSLAAFLESPWTMLSMSVYSEPILIGFFLIGVALLLKERRSIGFLLFGWFLAYTAVFYIVFRFDPRFALALVPFYALAGGYVVDRWWNTWARFALILLLLVPLVIAARVEYLAYESDTRDMAREWALLNLDASDKVLVYVAHMRLPTTADAVEELRAVDSNVVRQVDGADVVLDRKDVPHVLNYLFSMKKDSVFIRDISAYAKNNGYTHLIFAPEYATEATSTAEAFSRLTKGAKELQRFEGRGVLMSIADSSFTNSFLEFFDERYFGPTIIIYAL
ncbi:glycosyltransferase family 39 protein [Candidatus Kaiserbacteria bacterium]|nr:glycosyltransferase family 39 protein [Candidatus Kaiserbacteria bacterium]